MSAPTLTGVREDFLEIVRLVRPGARVLDVGCGEGDLLDMLVREKQVDGRGIEISPEGVSACLARGLAGPRRYRLLARLLLGVKRPRRPIFGMVLAGQIESVGRNVRSFQPGDQVVW